MILSKALRVVTSSVSLFLIGIVTSTAAIAGIGGISPPTNNEDNDIVTRLEENSITIEQAVVAARAIGLELSVSESVN